MHLLADLFAKARNRFTGDIQGSCLPKTFPKAAGFALVGAAAAYQLWATAPAQTVCQEALCETADEQEFVNWSATHKVRPRQLFQPETVHELQQVVASCHASGQRIRVVGSGLSPNGMAFCPEGMLSTALLDKIISVDKDKQQVTVQAGARVQEVVDALRPHGLTLQNFASIREQTMGGFTQVGSHGSGATIPPVDEQVVSMKLVTPARGCLELSKEKDPELFRMARVGLGCLGVVAELTIQCVPSHQLLQHTLVMTRRQVHQQHKQLLQANRHLRYMWLPYTDAVVVVTCNAYKEGEALPACPPPASPDHQLAPFRELLHSLCGKLRQGVAPQEDLPGPTLEAVDRMSGTELRDHLLAIDPLDHLWVARVNQAEAEWWKRCEGYQQGWSDWLLGFDCGGQQWVLEACFPAGTVKEPNGADLQYMEDLMRELEAARIPAPSPIEQRWTCGSASHMSPAGVASGQGDCQEHLFSWVGIIMYLPSDNDRQRAAITKRYVFAPQARTAVEHMCVCRHPLCCMRRHGSMQQTGQVMLPILWALML
ncbi:hypothetical protein ABBQ32_011105 [Trebouxia sp. C0010 RCD-2024]